MPGCTDDSVKIFEEIKRELGCDFYVSLMSQYTPFYKGKEIEGFNRRLKPIEYRKVVNKVFNLGFKRGFVQDFSSASEDFTPDFSFNNFFEL